MNISELSIHNLRVSLGDKQILRGVSLAVRPGEVHAIMGPNGSGKSTLSAAIMGKPEYTVLAGSVITLTGKNITKFPTEKRAKLGLFLALQNPLAIPGVSANNLLRTAYAEIYGAPKRNQAAIQNPVLAKRWIAGGMTIGEFTDKLTSFASLLHLDEEFLNRGINDGFSGGERKKMEMLQALVLQPKFAIFDEIDTGLDVDALKLVAQAMSLLKRGGTGIIVVTHYQRILKYLRPNFVHVLVAGQIVKSGTATIVSQIEKNGYRQFES